MQRAVERWILIAVSPPTTICMQIRPISMNFNKHNYYDLKQQKWHLDSDPFKVNYTVSLRRLPPLYAVNRVGDIKWEVRRGLENKETVLIRF